MVNQHAKWLESTNQIPWRNKLASLNILLASHVWRQDHNGFTHQDPGFLQHVSTKKPQVVRIYLPPDANCLLSVTNHCLKSHHYINVIVAGKHPSPQWLTPEEAHQHCSQGIGIWEWASTDQGHPEPDLVLACAGDVPTLEALAAMSIVREKMPSLRIRFVNVVNLMKLHPHNRHPNGLSDAEFDSVFTKDKPVLFNFHAYPQMIHSLIFGRTNQQNFTVKGYEEEGAITTPFDMGVLNGIDRLHLVQDICDIVLSKSYSHNYNNYNSNAQKASSMHDYKHNSDGWSAAHVRQEMQQQLIAHKQYIEEYGVDMPEIANWEWSRQQEQQQQQESASSGIIV